MLSKGYNMPEDIDLALLIALIGAHQSQKIEGRTRIQKLVCILKTRDKLPFTFDFKPYFYGPYSDELSEDINTLIGMKLLEETITPIGFGSYRYDYSFTKNAQRLFSKLETASPEIVRKLRDKIKLLENMKTPDLVKLAKESSGIESVSS